MLNSGDAARVSVMADVLDALSHACTTVGVGI
jgi:hypothetical protein